MSFDSTSVMTIVRASFYNAEIDSHVFTVSEYYKY